jgi:anti-sigma regulatory factor (Ser/Thr protein kinase)
MEVALRVTDATAVAEARRKAVQLAVHLGFSESEAGKIAVVVTELATNLLKHGGGGELLAGELRGSKRGLDLLALDKGAGIDNPAEAFRDGFSTAGSPGTGLGSVARLSHFFDLYTGSGLGTAILARFWVQPNAVLKDFLEVAGLSVPRVGELACGDAWAVEQESQRAQILVADGLGHGEQAAYASGEAVQAFRNQRGNSPVAIVEAIHLALRGTRGAAVALLEVDALGGQVRYVGVGNITGAVISPGASRRLASHNGTAGHQVVRIQEFTYPIPPGALLVLHSDGLNTHWNLDSYPGLAARHPGIIAGVLYRDFNRGRDDATVVVARIAQRV